MLKKTLMLAVLVPILGGCEDTTSPNGAGQVAVRFQAATSTSASASRSPAGARFDQVPATGAITLTGSNGTLVIQDIRLIVSELELESAQGTCGAVSSKDAEHEDDESRCPKFEGGPFLVNLLDGTAAQVVTSAVPAGSYTEFQFKVEDLEDDEGDDHAEQQSLQDILTELRKTYPDFPSRASMVVHGTFTPTGGTARPFTTYFDAELEIEKEFPTPFRVPEDGTILVNLDPAAWFQQGPQVLNLLALDGRTVEFEVEARHGFEVEHHD